MARASKAEVEITLGGEQRTLALHIDDLETIEARTGYGTGNIVDHLQVGYRISEIRTIYQVAFERQNLDAKKDAPKVPADKETVLRMMMYELPQQHVNNCIRLINAAFEPIAGNADAPERESG